jgi:hypothetical protein
VYVLAPNRRIVVARLLAVALLPILGRTAHGAEPDKEACIEASHRGQDLRDAGHLLAARDKFSLCAREACPRVVRTFCEQWRKEVDEDVPTVRIRALKEGGEGLGDVRVSIDGVQVGEQERAAPIALDPGAHRIRFEHDGFSPVDRDVNVRARDKNTDVAATMVPVVPPAPAAKNTPPAFPSTDSAPAAKRSALPFIVAGIGVVALGSALYFGISGVRQFNDLSGSCKPHCPQAEIDADHRQLVVADISAGIAILALGAATWLFLSAPTSRAASTRRSAPVAAF